MLSRKKTMLIITILFVASMIMSACQPAATPVVTAEEPIVEQPVVAPTTEVKVEATKAPEPTAVISEPVNRDIVIAVPGDISGWDPAQTIIIWANEIVVNTYDNLIATMPATDEYGNPIRDMENFRPSLAESWEVKDEGKTYTFYLRKGVKFNNGDELKAQDVKDTFVYQTKVQAAVGRLTAILTIPDPEKQITVDDEYTVSFHLDAPNNLFLKAMTRPNYVIVNAKQIWESGSTDEEQQKFANANITGTGPYIVDNYEAGVQLVLKAKEDYWNGRPFFDHIIYKVVPTAENRLLLLKNGDVDLAYEIPLKDLEDLQNTPGIKVYTVPTYAQVLMYAGNLQQPPWNDVNLRMAIGYAIPYDTIIEDVTYGKAKRLKSWLPVGMEGYTEVSPLEYNLDKAKEYLTKAGYPDGKGLPPITFNLRQGTPEDEEIAVYIQAELAKLGITMEIQPLPLATHSDQISKHLLPFTFNIWSPYVPDPYYNFYFNYDMNKTGCCNYSDYKDQEITDWIQAIRSETDQEKRLEFILKVQEKLATVIPNIPIYQPTFNIAMRDNIEGFSYYPDNQLRYYEMSRK